MRALAALLGLVVGCGQAPPHPASSGPRPAPPSPAVAFREVTVIPMDRERRLAGYTVVTREGRIVALGPSGAVAIPPGTTVIDGRGKFLMPGLADMHVHPVSLASLVMEVANGVTTVRNMGGAPIYLAWRAQIAAGERLGPTIVTAGPILDGRKLATGSADAAAEVWAQRRAGYDFLKVYNRLSLPAFAAVVAAAREAGMPITGHVADEVGLERALAEGQRSIEHLEGWSDAVEADDSPVRGQDDFQGWLQRPFHGDPAKLADMVAKTRAAGSWNCPTLLLRERWVTPAEGARLMQEPGMQYVAPVLRASWDTSKDQRSTRIPPETYATMRRHGEVNGAIVRALSQAGAGILLGTDESNPFVAPGYAVHLELAMLVRAGLSPYQALRAGTSGAAEFLGGDFGVVAVGRRADLLLLDGDPLADVGNLRRRVGVMLRGRWLPAAELERRLEEVRASYRPAADRFAGRPALAREGTREWAATYAIDLNGQVFGEERVAIDRLPDGRRVLHAQLVTDAPDVVWLESRIELSAQGRHLALEVRSEGSEGAGEVSLRRLGSVVRVAGKLPVFGEFHLERRIDDEAELGAEGFSEIVPEPFAAAALAHASWHGEGARQVLVLGADPTLERDRWEVAAGEAGAGPLALTVRRQQSRQTRTVRLDADGRLADLTIQWFGVIGVHRVPR